PDRGEDALQAPPSLQGWEAPGLSGGDRPRGSVAEHSLRPHPRVRGGRVVGVSGPCAPKGLSASVVDVWAQTKRRTGRPRAFRPPETATTRSQGQAARPPQQSWHPLRVKD